MATAKKVKQKRHETPASTAPRKPASAKKPAAAPTPKAPEKAASKPARKKPSVKMARDTFRMPATEFDALRKLKARAKSLGVPAKKSEILRAGLRTLVRLDDEHFAVLLAQVQNP